MYEDELRELSGQFVLLGSKLEELKRELSSSRADLLALVNYFYMGILRSNLQENIINIVKKWQVDFQRSSAARSVGEVFNVDDHMRICLGANKVECYIAVSASELNPFRGVGDLIESRLKIIIAGECERRFPEIESLLLDYCKLEDSLRVVYRNIQEIFDAVPEWINFGDERAILDILGETRRNTQINNVSVKHKSQEVNKEFEKEFLEDDDYHHEDLLPDLSEGTYASNCLEGSVVENNLSKTIEICGLYLPKLESFHASCKKLRESIVTAINGIVVTDEACSHLVNDYRKIIEKLIDRINELEQKSIDECESGEIRIELNYIRQEFDALARKGSVGDCSTTIGSAYLRCASVAIEKDILKLSNKLVDIEVLVDEFPFDIIKHYSKAIEALSGKVNRLYGRLSLLDYLFVSQDLKQDTSSIMDEFRRFCKDFSDLCLNLRAASLAGQRCAVVAIGVKLSELLNRVEAIKKLPAEFDFSELSRSIEGFRVFCARVLTGDAAAERDLLESLNWTENTELPLELDEVGRVEIDLISLDNEDLSDVGTSSIHSSTNASTLVSDAEASMASDLERDLILLI